MLLASRGEIIQSRTQIFNIYLKPYSTLVSCSGYAREVTYNTKSVNRCSCDTICNYGEEENGMAGARRWACTLNGTHGMKMYQVYLVIREENSALKFVLYDNFQQTTSNSAIVTRGARTLYFLFFIAKHTGNDSPLYKYSYNRPDSRRLSKQVLPPECFFQKSGCTLFDVWRMRLQWFFILNKFLFTHIQWELLMPQSQYYPCFVKGVAYIYNPIVLLSSRLIPFCWHTVRRLIVANVLQPLV